MLNNSASKDFLFSSIPAVWVDRLQLYSPDVRSSAQKSVSQVCASALGRLVNTTVLPIFLILDTVFSLIKIGYRFPYYAFHQTDKNWEKAVKTVEVFQKCLGGVIAFPLEFIWLSSISNHYLPELKNDHLIQPTGGLYQTIADADQLLLPENEEEIAQAIKSGKKISIRGAGFSQGKHILPNDNNSIHLNMGKIKHVVIDAQRKTATVGAGATWADIQREAEKHQLAVQVMQASNVFSVGGSLSANCHGWDHTQGSLANTVNSVQIVDNEGKIQTLTPDDDLFRYVVGGWGMFGVIVQVELKLTTNDMLQDTSVSVPIDKYPSHFRNVVEKNKDIKLHLYRLSLERGKLLETGWAQNYVYKRPIKQHVLNPDEPPRGTGLQRMVFQFARHSAWARGVYWRNEMAEMAKKDKAPLSRNAIMRPLINAAFANNSRGTREWLQEYFVKEEDLAQFLKFLAQKLNKNDVALLNASVRFVKKDELSKLGYATKGDRFAVVLYFSQSLNPNEIENTKNWVQEVINYLNEHEGSFYLPYAHLATRPQFQTSYPQYKEVLEAKQRYDPDNVFDNGFFSDYLKEIN